MNITIQPNKLSGKVTVPMSKSYALRATLCHALSGAGGPACGLKAAGECPAPSGQCAETAYNCGVPKSV